MLAVGFKITQLVAQQQKRHQQAHRHGLQDQRRSQNRTQRHCTATDHQHTHQPEHQHYTETAAFEVDRFEGITQRPRQPQQTEQQKVNASQADKIERDGTGEQKTEHPQPKMTPYGTYLPLTIGIASQQWQIAVVVDQVDPGLQQHATGQHQQCLKDVELPLLPGQQQTDTAGDQCYREGERPNCTDESIFVRSFHSGLLPNKVFKKVMQKMGSIGSPLNCSQISVY